MSYKKFCHVLSYGTEQCKIFFDSEYAASIPHCRWNDSLYVETRTKSPPVITINLIASSELSCGTEPKIQCALMVMPCQTTLIQAFCCDRLKPIDVECMKRLHHKVNIIPVIGKADTLTRPEIIRNKIKVKNDSFQNNFVYLHYWC